MFDKDTCVWLGRANAPIWGLSEAKKKGCVIYVSPNSIRKLVERYPDSYLRMTGSWMRMLFNQICYDFDGDSVRIACFAIEGRDVRLYEVDATFDEEGDLRVDEVRDIRPGDWKPVKADSRRDRKKRALHHD